MSNRVSLAPGYPVTPIIFLALIVVLLVLLGSNNPRQSFLGVAVVIISLPVYHFLFRREIGGAGKSATG
ncbi:MAG: hypothetical protein M3R67_13235 [Acidobacteriota bacterium]|nr:hypothetical protein [Acidobacteriota bacterium]